MFTVHLALFLFFRFKVVKLYSCYVVIIIYRFPKIVIYWFYPNIIVLRYKTSPVTNFEEKLFYFIQVKSVELFKINNIYV
jgi:hypothetical protein